MVSCLVWDLASVGIRMDAEEIIIIQQRTRRATHGLLRILLEGVADRDWGIAFSVVNGRINKQKFLSDLYFTQKVSSLILFYSDTILGSSTHKSGS